MAALPNSILDDTKKLLGISPDDPSFDTDVMIHINSTFSILHQLGVGPADGFEITSKNQLWADFLGTNKLVNNAKTLVYLQTRLWFDPPTNGGDLAAKKEQLLELQWRINVAADKTHLLADGSDIYSAGAFMWELEGENIWPPEAEEGDLGVFPETGNVWRKS